MDMPRVIEIENGEAVRGTFSGAEMNARLARLRALMATPGIDVALFTSYHNICYYGDFLYCSFGRDYALVVTQDRIASVFANIDGGQPWRRGFGGDNLVYQPVEKGVIDRVSRHGEAYRGEGGFAILRDDEDDLNDQDGSSGRNKHEQGANSARHGLLRGAGADELAHQQR